MNYFFCFHRHTRVYEQSIDFQLLNTLFKELGGGHLTGIVEEVRVSLGVNFDFEEEVVDVTYCALIMINNFREESRCESRVYVVIFEYWKKLSTS